MRKEYEDDDGRVICPMDVEGMPESVFRMRGGIAGMRREREGIRRKADAGEPLTRAEYRKYTWYAVLGGLTVIGVIGGGTVLFIFLLTLIWR